MAGDLISRSALLQIIQEDKGFLQKGLGGDADYAYMTADSVIEKIKSMPAAYDVDKVLGQLEILLEKETALICRHVSDASYMAGIIGHTMPVDAVEVVRTGGTGIKVAKSGGAADE